MLDVEQFLFLVSTLNNLHSGNSLYVIQETLPRAILDYCPMLLLFCPSYSIVDKRA
jgi:hypothetical protein